MPVGFDQRRYPGQQFRLDGYRRIETGNDRQVKRQVTFYQVFGGPAVEIDDCDRADHYPDAAGWTAGPLFAFGDPALHDRDHVRVGAPAEFHFVGHFTSQTA